MPCCSLVTKKNEGRKERIGQGKPLTLNIMKKGINMGVVYLLWKATHLGMTVLLNPEPYTFKARGGCTTGCSAARCSTAPRAVQ